MDLIRIKEKGSNLLCINLLDFYFDSVIPFISYKMEF